ncbi:MAG: hypothetical protein U1E76_14885 [Planctomycetota bacterium]
MWLLLALVAQTAAIDATLAQRYFAEAEALSKQDGGKLWGVTLYGPMLLVDASSGVAVANQADAEGKLVRQGAVFVGSVPNDFPSANTATRWAGVAWTMILWPLPLDRTERGALMVHELFHRVQDQLGFAGGNPANAHLDTLEGRFLLQLEWRALRAALTSTGDSQQAALEDALVFRARRRELYPKAADEERSLEHNEGLAEYTGFKVGIADEAPARDLMVRRLNGAHLRPTFVRSFAYETGPAYGLLLDQCDPEWRTRLGTAADFLDILQAALGIELPDDLAGAVASRAERYDGHALRGTEQERDRTRQAQLAAYRATLVTGAVLELPPSAAMQYSFDPNELLPMDDLGTVYPHIQITDDWGSLAAQRGALLSADRKQLFVAAPRDPGQLGASANGWTMSLAPGWQLVPGPRPGDLRAARQ